MLLLFSSPPAERDARFNSGARWKWLATESRFELRPLLERDTWDTDIWICPEPLLVRREVRIRGTWET